MRNLFLAGQDAGSPGIVGAMMGGVAAACQVLGPRGYPTITSALRAPVPESVSSASCPLPEGKHHAILASKRRLTPSTWVLEFDIQGTVGPWAPGQFARVHVGGNAWRDYSIVGLDGRRLRLFVSTRTGGMGSRFAEGAEPGARTIVELPLGGFALADSGHRRLFVATGTGIAPMLAMFARARDLEGDTLVFGCRDEREDLTRGFEAPMPGRVLRCLSRQETPETFHGRVTDFLDGPGLGPEMLPDLTDVYLCGSAAMVAEVRSILERKGYDRVFTEPY